MKNTRHGCGERYFRWLQKCDVVSDAINERMAPPSYPQWKIGFEGGE
ncbi:MAG: hypothetical protein JW943_05085 [Deltaproteobacteria bacterium]|nr:hypothetical protein [Deltaproteobacteria bacterium]